MKLDTEVLSLVTNVGTIVMCMFIIDRAYRLALRWLELQNDQMRFLSREQLYGPKPIRLTKEVREANTPA